MIQVGMRKRDWKEAVSEVGKIQARKLFHLGGVFNCVKRKQTDGSENRYNNALRE